MAVEFLHEPLLWGVTAWRLMAAALIVFFGFAARRLLLYLFRNVLASRARKTRVSWDDELVRFIPPPLSAIVLIGLWFGAAVLLQLPAEPVDIQRYVFQGLTVALAIALVWLLFRIVDVMAGALARVSARTASKLDDQLIPLFRKTTKLIVALVAGVMIIQNLGYSVTSLIASLGVGGLALALAAKDTVANMFGSVVVFTDRPFQVGDWVQFSDIEGTVEEVGFRTTQVRRFDQSIVSVPNAMFSSTPIVNHSRRPLRRISMTVGVSYETSAEQMRELLGRLRELIANHEAIDQGYNFVHFNGFGDSSLNLNIYCFTRTTVWTEFLEAQEDIMLSIMDIVNELGLEIAFPTRTVYLRDEHWQAKQME